MTRDQRHASGPGELLPTRRDTDALLELHSPGRLVLPGVSSSRVHGGLLQRSINDTGQEPQLVD
jgi:hypothetical protein